MEDDFELEQETDEPDNFELDPFDVWRDNHPEEWERILGR